MKKIAKAVITTENRYEHGDIVLLKFWESACVFYRKTGIVAKANETEFVAFVPTIGEYVTLRHDDKDVEYVGRVTKTNVIGK